MVRIANHKNLLVALNSVKSKPPNLAYFALVIGASENKIYEEKDVLS